MRDVHEYILIMTSEIFEARDLTGWLGSNVLVCPQFHGL